MGQTRYFSLAFFDFGDRLNTSINVQKEIDRFVVIDKQLFGMYNIFGNGVIDGFNVSDAGFQATKGISVNIAEGTGIIDHLAAEMQVPGTVNNLPPNIVVDIYASITGSTYLDRTVIFQYSLTPLASGIKLATVSTGADSILFIDNTTRDLIGFEQIIQEAINEHKHRGTPSKIDLPTETKNQLPGARLEGIDASKVVSGRFDVDRIPLVDHNELENNGLLTHAALDSFIKTFSQSNRELLGEINTVNLIKSIVFWKYKFADADEFFINELVLIPGISPSSYIDFNASTAIVSVNDGCISGIPSKTGIFASVFWNDTFSFNNATFQENVIIQNDTVFIDASSSSTDSIANFDSGVMPFEDSMIIIDRDQKAVVVNIDGNNAGQLGGGGVLNYFYRINFSEPRNWFGIYDELVIKIKTTEEIHDSVNMYLVNGNNVNDNGQFGSLEVGDIDGVKKPSSEWQILAKDESMADFVEKVFDITALELNDVTQLTIYTEDSFIFEIDDIAVRRNNIISETGTIRFQYGTEASVTFHSIFFEAETPTGTGISVRVKIAASTELLSRASYSFPLNTGDVVALSGSAAEIEVVMSSDESRTISPVLSSVELRLLTDADFTGFEIDTESEWVRGQLANLTIDPAEQIGKEVLNISTPINVGGRYFANAGSISENNDADDAVYGFSGAPGGEGRYGMPISPVQARDWNVSSSRGFATVTSVVRRFDNTFLIADMENNRILQVDRDGNLVKGFGSTYSTDSDFYPLSAVYNNDSKVLTVVFTAVPEVEDITKISLILGSAEIVLTENEEVLTAASGKTTNEEKVLQIKLDDDTAVRLLNATPDNLTVFFNNGAFTQNIVVNDNMKAQGNSIFSTEKGLVCFVGDFIFIDNIRHPIFVYENREENFMWGNSSIFYIVNPNEDVVTVPDIVEIDPNDVTNSTDKLVSSEVKFSDFTLGGIVESTIDGTFIIAGLVESDTTLGGITGSDLLDAHGGSDDAPEDVKFRAAAIDALAVMAGRVFTIDKVNNRQQVKYTSPDGLYPSDVDKYDNGDDAVAESAVASASGRLIRLDTFGNITWSYGSGQFHIINDNKVISADNLIVSV